MCGILHWESMEHTQCYTISHGFVLINYLVHDEKPRTYNLTDLKALCLRMHDFSENHMPIQCTYGVDRKLKIANSIKWMWMEKL